MNAISLVRKLDGLPLALATAGAYLKRTSVSLSDYRRLYEMSWERVHTSAPALGSYQDRTLCSTWQLSYDQVQIQNPLAAHLLRWWAYFDNEDIWLELLRGRRRSRRHSRHEDDPSWISELSVELDFNSAMGTLSDYGLVEPSALAPDTKWSRGYSIHSCLHSWTIHILNKGNDDRLAKVAIERVASCVPSEEGGQFWPLRRRLLPHAVKSCATIKDYPIQDHDELSWAFFYLAMLHEDQGKYVEAENIYLRALLGDEKARGPDHPLTLVTRHKLATFYANQGKYAEAKEMYIRALRVSKKALGPDHPSTLATLQNLATVHYNEGSYADAKEIFVRMLGERERALEPDHPTTLTIVRGLGSLYRHQGKYSEAEELFLRALRGYEKTFGPEHPSTLNILNDLGVLY